MTRALEYAHIIVLLAIPLVWAVLILAVDGNAEYWLRYWWMLPIGLVISTVVNTVGISGAALFVPFFLLVFPILASPLDPEQSVKLGLLTESFGLTSSALAFFRFGLVDTKLGGYTALGAVPFVVAGGALAFVIPEYAFYFLVASALGLGVALMISKQRRDSKRECILKEVVDKSHPDHDENVVLRSREGQEFRYCRCGWTKRFFGYGAGAVFQGLGGFGIGELGIVSMLSTNIPVRVAIGTTHIVVAATAITATATHLVGSSLSGAGTPWNIVFWTVPAAIAGGQLAPYVAARIHQETLEVLVAGLFAILTVVLVVLGLRAL